MVWVTAVLRLWGPHGLAEGRQRLRSAPLHSGESPLAQTGRCVSPSETGFTVGVLYGGKEGDSGFLELVGVSEAVSILTCFTRCFNPNHRHCASFLVILKCSRIALKLLRAVNLWICFGLVLGKRKQYNMLSFSKILIIRHWIINKQNTVGLQHSKIPNTCFALNWHSDIWARQFSVFWQFSSSTPLVLSSYSHLIGLHILSETFFFFFQFWRIKCGTPSQAARPPGWWPSCTSSLRATLQSWMGTTETPR